MTQGGQLLNGPSSKKLLEVMGGGKFLVNTIILLIGPSGCGKDRAIKRLAYEHGYNLWTDLRLEARLKEQRESSILGRAYGVKGLGAGELTQGGAEREFDLRDIYDRPFTNGDLLEGALELAAESTSVSGK